MLGTGIRTLVHWFMGPVSSYYITSCEQSSGGSTHLVSEYEYNSWCALFTLSVRLYSRYAVTSLAVAGGIRVRPFLIHHVLVNCQPGWSWPPASMGSTIGDCYG